MEVCQFDGCESKAELRGFCKKHYHTMRRRGKLPPLPVAKNDKCKVEDCENLVGGAGGYGYCSMHYQRYKKYGDPLKAITPHLKGKTIEEKLLNNREIDENDCWNWTGARISPKSSKFRYGTLNVGKGKTELVHRLAYTLWIAKIPFGLFVCHKCDNPACFNPDHLFVGDNQDNMRDKVKKGRSYTGDHKGENNAAAKLTTEQVQDIKQLLTDGMKYKFIAEKYGITSAAVSAIKNEDRWGHIPWPKEWEKVKSEKKYLYSGKGEENPNSSLTNDTVLKIKYYLKKGKSVSAIAKRYKVNASVIYDVRNERSWKHLVLPADYHPRKIS